MIHHLKKRTSGQRAKGGPDQDPGTASEINDTVEKYCANLANDGKRIQDSRGAPVTSSWASVAAKITGQGFQHLCDAP